MYRLSDITKLNIEKSLGMPVSEFSALSPEQEKMQIEKRTGRKLIFSKKKNEGRAGRGNALLARKKYKTDQDYEEKSRELFGL